MTKVDTAIKSAVRRDRRVRLNFVVTPYWILLVQYLVQLVVGVSADCFWISPHHAKHRHPTGPDEPD
jgi:hypothetical protein